MIKKYFYCYCVKYVKACEDREFFPGKKYLVNVEETKSFFVFIYKKGEDYKGYRFYKLNEEEEIVYSLSFDKYFVEEKSPRIRKLKLDSLF